MILERFNERALAWQQAGLQRQVSPVADDQRVFCSNNYLGLADHPRLKQAMITATEKYGVGTGASHLVVGYTKQHQQTEQAYAQAFGFEAAMLFSCGYMANVGVQQALLSRHDVVYHDRLNHASLLDGARLSGAKLQRFHHLDYDHLESLLQRKNGLVVTDSVFSMQGDQADLNRLVQLRQHHGFTLMVDDAHGVGVVGRNGQGSLQQAGLTAQDVDILVCPLGKAFGCFGAVVFAKQTVIDALRQFSRSYIYTTAMPAAMAAVAQEALAVVQQESWRHARLQELIQYFKQTAKQHGVVLLPSDTAIQALVTGSVESCCRLSEVLAKSGFKITAIRQPTVPVGSEQLRFTLNVGQSESDIDRLMQVIEQEVCHVC